MPECAQTPFVLFNGVVTLSFCMEHVPICFRMILPEPMMTRSLDHICISRTECVELRMCEIHVLPDLTNYLDIILLLEINRD